MPQPKVHRNTTPPQPVVAVEAQPSTSEAVMFVEQEAAPKPKRKRLSKKAS
jgi:hypothetical protein